MSKFALLESSHWEVLITFVDLWHRGGRELSKLWILESSHASCQSHWRRGTNHIGARSATSNHIGAIVLWQVAKSQKKYTELRFVTNIMNYIRGGKTVMWRNFSFLYRIWTIYGALSKFITLLFQIYVEKNLCGEKMTNMRSEIILAPSFFGMLQKFKIATPSNPRKGKSNQFKSVQSEKKSQNPLLTIEKSKQSHQSHLQIWNRKNGYCVLHWSSAM